MSLGEPAGDVTARETAALYRIARLLAGRQRLADVFEEVAEQIGEHVRLDFASLMVLDAEPDMERVVGWYPPEAIDGSDNQQYRRSRGRQLLADQYRRGVEWDPAEFRGRAERRMTAFGIKLAWSMPLLDGDDYYGTVTVARIEAESFAERELEFLRRAGDLLAAAAREEHAIWRADREGVRSRLLNELTILLNQGRSVEELFSAMVAVLSRAVTFDAAGLMRTNESNQLGLVAADPPELGMVLNDVEVDVEGAAIRNADRWLQFAPTEVGGDIGERLAAAGIRMACAVFLTHLGKTVGALILSRGTMREFSEDDLSFLALAATLMAQAIVNRDVVERELEESRAETAEQRALAAIAAISADERTPSRLLEGFAATLGRFVPAVRSAFAVLEGDGLTVYRSHSTPLLGDASMLGKMANLPGQVTLSSGYEDLLGDWDWFGGGTIRAVSIAPDRSAGSLRGVLIVAAGEPGWDFGEREERVVRTAAQFVGSALHTAHNLKRLERSRALLELVVGSLSAGIVLFDRQGQAAFVNGHGQRVLDSLRPQSMSGGIPVSDEEPGTGVDKLLQALAGSWFATGEAALEFAGESRLHRYEILPMDHDSYSRLVVFEDIEEERRRAAENERHQQQMSQAARLSALGEMIGGVAHELNNPLTAILGFAELLTAD